MTEKLTDLKDILNTNDLKSVEKIQKEYENRSDFLYVKDNEGFVKKIYAEEMNPEYTVITREEWEEESGEKYYKKTFGRGGKREGAGRKPTTGVVLKFQIRVSEKEKKFIQYARSHNLNYDELMQG